MNETGRCAPGHSAPFSASKCKSKLLLIYEYELVTGTLKSNSSADWYLSKMNRCTSFGCCCNFETNSIQILGTVYNLLYLPQTPKLRWNVQLKSKYWKLWSLWGRMRGRKKGNEWNGGRAADPKLNLRRRTEHRWEKLHKNPIWWAHSFQQPPAAGHGTDLRKNKYFTFGESEYYCAWFMNRWAEWLAPDFDTWPLFSSRAQRRVEEHVMNDSQIKWMAAAEINSW